METQVYRGQALTWEEISPGVGGRGCDKEPCRWIDYITSRLTSAAALDTCGLSVQYRAGVSYTSFLFSLPFFHLPPSFGL